MTDSSAPVGVEQVDREEAADLIDTYEGKQRYAAQVRAGHRDDHPVVRAFARHRLAERERCAKVAEAWVSSLRPGSNERANGHAEARADIATAIRENAHVG